MISNKAECGTTVDQLLVLIDENPVNANLGIEYYFGKFKTSFNFMCCLCYPFAFSIAAIRISFQLSEAFMEFRLHYLSCIPGQISQLNVKKIHCLCKLCFKFGETRKSALLSP